MKNLNRPSKPAVEKPVQSSIKKIDRPASAGQQENNPLHGVKLADIVVHLEKTYGWEELGNRIRINCFTHDPSIKSSLKFLRRTPWARDKVEQLYLRSLSKK